MAHITDLKLYKENDQYYLSALIAHEDDKGIYEVSIPKIQFPVAPECIIEHIQQSGYYKPSITVGLDFGLGMLYAQPFNSEGTYFTIECVEEKVHKMTLADIERELGYKVEIIKEN